MKKCPICQTSIYEDALYEFTIGKVFLCQKCSLGIFDGEPSVYKGANINERDIAEHVKKIVMAYEFNYLKHRKRMRILEVGSGSGILANYLHLMGHEIECCDIDKNNLQRIKQKYGFETILGDFESLQLKREYYDAIIMRHVFEHFENPLLVVKIVSLALKLNGSFIISLPNFNSWSRKISGHKWTWTIPHHRFFWSSESLTKLLEQNGYRVAKSITLFSHTGLPFVLTKLINPAFLRYLFYPFVMILGINLELISLIFQSGQNLFIEAIKKR